MTEGARTLITLLMSTGLTLAVAHLFLPIPLYWGALPLWLAALIQLPRLSALLRNQVLLLSLCGLAPMSMVLYMGKAVEWQRALAINMPLICIIMGAGMLKLVCLPPKGKEGKLAQGPRALWQTLLGVHAFSAAINMSALYIAGDRLSAHKPLTLNQGSLLARAFTTSMFWSPLMAGMALALSWAPGASLGSLIHWGLPLSLLMMAVTVWQIRLNDKTEFLGFNGFPVSLGSLAIPLALTLLVLTISHFEPTLSIPLLVSGAAPLITLLIKGLGGGRQGLEDVARHGRLQMPAMGGELCLFLAAGVFAVGLSSAFNALGAGHMAVTLNHWHTAAILVGIVVLAYLGLHPIASIAIAGSWTQAMTVDPNLLAFTYLASWSIGVVANPFSGTMLAMVSRYGLPYPALRRHNLPFVAASLALAIGAMIFIA